MTPSPTAAPVPASPDKVRISPRPGEHDEVLVYLPYVSYLDTQAGPVEIGLPGIYLPELAAAIHGPVPAGDEAGQMLVRERERHYPEGNDFASQDCAHCRDRWPCDATRLLNLLDQMLCSDPARGGNHAG